MNVMQEWTHSLPMMQQTVLLTAIRGPDGLPKYGCVKLLIRWYRRCVLLSAMDGRALTDPCESNGGSFTGPSLQAGQPVDDWEHHMNAIVAEYIQTTDAIPHHFQMHFLHAVEIVGYKHPTARIQQWWHLLYLGLVNDLHLHPELKSEMDDRLRNDRSGWLKRADEATVN